MMTWLADLLEPVGDSIDNTVLWMERHIVWFKSALGIIFLVGMCYANNYCAVLAAALVTGVIYSLLISLFYWHDRRLLRRAPAPRLRYFSGLVASECLICHEDVQDPVLLSCGHIYCASCIMPLIKENFTECAYCGQTPYAAHDMRLERIAIMQLALNITLGFDFALQCYIGGLRGGVASSLELHGGLKAVFGFPLAVYFNGLEYWWKGMADFKKRENRRKQLPAYLRWTRDVLDRMEVGWNWRDLLHSLPVAVSWSLMWGLIEEHEALQRQRAASAHCDQVCMCGGMPVDLSQCML